MARQGKINLFFKCGGSSVAYVGFCVGSSYTPHPAVINFYKDFTKINLTFKIKIILFFVENFQEKA
jgi:hypothetical protein